MRLKKVLYMGIAALLALTMAACSNSANNGSGQETQTPQPAQGTLIEPSQLISKTEAEEILGVALGDAVTSEQAEVGQKLCVYESEDNLLQVGLIQPASVPAGGLLPEEHYQAIVDAFEDAEQVEGIGDKACITPPGIRIMKDGYFITIALGNIDNEANIDMLKEAGKVAVNNLADFLGGQ